MIRKAVDKYHNQGLVALTRALTAHLHRRIDERTIPLTNLYFNLKYGRGESVMDRDWDNLLLYDACRYDEFVRVCPFSENAVKRRVTLGSKTTEFLQKTFNGGTYEDVVYITANPQPLKYASERQDSPFHAIISLLDQWDSETQTVPPEEVHQAALRAESEYPNKRLIIHFLQPHAPFIGPKAAKLRERTGKTIGGLDPGRSYTELNPQSIDTTSYHRLLQFEGITIEDIRTAYRETLAITTNSVIGLAGGLDGKTIITADHGELLGEKLHSLGIRRWEHPMDVRAPELCFVPWVECPYDDRKDIQSGTPKQSPQIDQEVVDERLHSLGYIE